MQASPTLKPVTIACAPNGGRRTKADHPAIPLTIEELAGTAMACADAGAAMIHVHVRKADGTHLLDSEAYRAAMAAIEAAIGKRLVIQITSESLGLYGPAEQRAVVCAVKPEAVSLALREWLPDASEEAAFGEMLLWMKRETIVPQIILYTPEEATALQALQARGLIPWDTVPVLYVLGRYTANQLSMPSDLLPFLAPGQPAHDHWSVCAFGHHEAACVTMAALLGGHVRVGFENNLFLPDGRTAGSNSELVLTVRTAMEQCGVRIGTADDIRGMVC